MYLKVLLPLRLDWMPSYFSETPVPEGTRVQVHFARKKYIGVVLGPDEAPSVAAEKILPIDGLAEGLPDITAEEISFWEFLSSYYMCTLGEVYKAVYPQGRTESEFVGARKSARNGGSSTTNTKQSQQSLPSTPEVLAMPDRTDKYVSEIEATISEGRDAMVLVPEFKLAAGLQKKLKKKFGDNLLSFNTKMTVVQRRKVSETLRSGSNPVVVLGTRSALLLPFNGLGLIIVDEEQDAAYKQQDPAPRFNARDAAVVLAGIHDARIILGTCCPSLETLINLQSGKYQLLNCSHQISNSVAILQSLSRRPGHPSADVPPTAQEWGDHEMVGSAQPTPRKGVRDGGPKVIDITAEKRKQGMRGDISFKLEDEIRAAKGKIALVRGWEKEDELRQQLAGTFPDAKFNILRPFEVLENQAHYSLIAVLQADALFDKSDFRSDERVLQTLSRLACKTEKLVIQTARASHTVFKLLQSDCNATPLLEERKVFNLPPYTRVVDTVLTDRNPGRLKKYAAILSNAQPKAQRIETEACIRFRTTLPRTPEAAKKKGQLTQSIRYIEKEYNYSGHIHFDVDPT